MYKDVFFVNHSLRELLIEAVVTVYIDAERTGYYEKSSFRFFASMVMEFIWSDAGYRAKFSQLGRERPGLFIEFCNFLINDLNKSTTCFSRDSLNWLRFATTKSCLPLQTGISWTRNRGSRCKPSSMKTNAKPNPTFNFQTW